MSTPITHIILASKLFKKYFSNKNFDDFIVGTCFPDIRYFLKLERNTTHFSDINEFSFSKNDDSFILGFKFHNLVDLLRKEYFDNKKELRLLISEYLSQFDISNINHSIILLEQFIFYNKISDWNNICNIFKNYKSKDFILNNVEFKKEDISIWNNYLEESFKEKPTEESTIKFSLLCNIPKNIAEKNFEIYNLIKNNENFIKILNDFYNDFDEIVKNKLN